MSAKTKKRRILRTLKLVEISGVDRPCQGGATVAIMKRAPTPDLSHLRKRILKLRTSVLQARVRQATG